MRQSDRHDDTPPTNAATEDYQEFALTPGYDDSHAITFPSQHTLGTKTHAALFLTSVNPEVTLYTVNPTSTLQNKIGQYVYSFPRQDEEQMFVVYTTAVGGTTPGGGVWLTTRDAQAPQGTGAKTQQANFLQYNPRAIAATYTGWSSDDHPVENALTNVRNGALGNDAYFTGDLMFDSSGDRVRWGTVNRGKDSPSLSGEAPTGTGADTGFVNILYSIPRADHPITSVAQLQHFSPSGYLDRDLYNNAEDRYPTQANTFQVNYPTGNSYPNPRVPREKVYVANTSAIGSTNVGIAYDASWLFNDVLADRFFFSSIPRTDALDFDSTANRLINHRLKPFRPSSEVPRSIAANTTTHYRGAPRTAATNLLLDGAFNINSTSREAWKAVLASLRDTPVLLSDDTTSVPADNPFSRTLYPAAGYANSRNGTSKEAWSGFHNLTDDEISDLADEIVLQIRRRGPFLSLADFLNRRLVESGNDPMGRGLSGAVQSAIDAILNKASDVDPVFRHQSGNTNFADTAFTARTLAAGSPGYLLQADLLSPLAANLAARSDTFVVRTYGDVQNPATGEITGRAWCEAVVQRTPDYIVSKPASGPVPTGANAPAEIPAAGTDNDKFGRRYTIVSFRWLSADDI